MEDINRGINMDINMDIKIDSTNKKLSKDLKELDLQWRKRYKGSKSYRKRRRRYDNFIKVNGVSIY